VEPKSNPLQRELARGKSTEPHPYEDVLAAFAENTLLEQERRKVIEHLSICRQCREVLSTATAAAPEAVIQEMPHVLPVRPPFRSWLPWVATAAVLLVVSSAVLLHERNAHLGERPTNPAATMAKAAATPPLGSDRSEVVVPKQGELNTQAPVSASHTPTLAAGEASGLDGGSSRTSARAHWRINEAGQAERSLGSGMWQPVMPDERARVRVISVFGSNVWLGGESPRLYHSKDDGTTWQLVQLPNKGIGAHAITHIRFQSEQAGTAEADDGTQWSTVDGGQTWK